MLSWDIEKLRYALYIINLLLNQQQIFKGDIKLLIWPISTFMYHV